jgi:hypothetical protein
MTIAEYNGCKVWRGFVELADLILLEDMVADLDFFAVGDVPTQMAAVYGTFGGRDFSHDSRELAYIINDLLTGFRETNFNIAFIRKVPDAGEKWRFLPKNNLEEVVLVPFGDFEGGGFMFGDRKFCMQTGDVATIPLNSDGSGCHPYMIEPIVAGSMYVLSLHNIKDNH